MALSLMFMFFRALELLQFSLELNLPIATLRGSMSDIINWLVIVSFYMYGYSITGYMVYCADLSEFETV